MACDDCYASRMQRRTGLRPANVAVDKNRAEMGPVAAPEPDPIE
jgi:hypothetical protein